jgi:conjugal transfer mating pair stabilization protein TraN
MDNDGGVSGAHEFESCGRGELYNRTTDFPGPGTALSCPLGKTPCARLDKNVCQIDASACGEFDAACHRPQACNPIIWDEDGGPAALVYHLASPTHYFCPSNGMTETNLTDATAHCRLMGEMIDDVIVIDGVVDFWLCLRTGNQFNSEAPAVADCTYIGDIGVAPIDVIPGVLENWHCLENNTAYATHSDGLAGCRVVHSISGFDCPSTAANDKHLTIAACAATCEQTGACAVEPGQMQCPLGAFDCINETPGSEDYFCSPSVCATYEEAGTYTPPVENAFTPNDGAMTQAGGCTDFIQIFNGKAQSCRLPGIASAYKNCCHEANEDLLTDSQGSVSQSVLWAAGINALYEAGAAAYAAYAALPAGSGASAAAGSSASAFQSSLLESLGSTTVIVTVAVVAVTTYLENACPAQGVVTAIKKKAHQCVLLGQICTTSFLGSCMQEREVHCCFNSLMATLIQVAGRAQLGQDFGTAEAPNCRGFTPQEFQSIDFSKIDLTAYYTEINTRAQGAVENEITTVVNAAARGI